MYSRQMREGMAYKELARAVTINIKTLDTQRGSLQMK
ncbi:hypothetical protein [Desulfosporosinus burensis]